MTAFLFALVAHGVIGGLDVVINHELTARLPRQPGAAPEQCLHSARELVFAVVFILAAWSEGYGWWALAIPALLGMELGISMVDSVLEPELRILPPGERIAHVALFVNLGLMLGLLGPVLAGRLAMPAALAGVDHGWLSWVLSAMAAGALAWSIRDAVSARGLFRKMQVAAP